MSFQSQEENKVLLTGLLHRRNTIACYSSRAPVFSSN